MLPFWVVTLNKGKGLKYYRRSFIHVPRITNDIFVSVTLRETKGLKKSRDLSAPQAPVQDDGDINAAVGLISDDSQNLYLLISSCSSWKKIRAIDSTGFSQIYSQL